MRWFADHLPGQGVTIQNLSDNWMGFAISGPKSRILIERLIDAELPNADFPFLSCAEMDAGMANAMVARLSLTGELGYEVNVPVAYQRPLYGRLRAVGADLGLRSIGNRALDSLRLEKSYGIWSTEFTQSYSPEMSGLRHFVAFDKGDFIGREAALKTRKDGVAKELVTLEIYTSDADASGFEPVKSGGKVVGYITSGAYGHHVQKSLALAYLDKGVIKSGAKLTVDVIGESRTAKVLAEPAYDPKGARLRA
jgi:dimethylglycine dehydrogenase